MTLLRGPLLDAVGQAHSTAVAARGLNAVDRERVHEDAFLRAATALEHFLTDWLVRALAADPSYLRNRLSKALQDDVNRRYVAGLAIGQVPERVMNALDVLNPSVVVTVPSRSKLRLADARKVIGVEESALSMWSFDEYARLAEQLLSSSRKSYLLGLNTGSRALLDVIIKLRHAIAHRSNRAATELNAALQIPALRAQYRSGAQAGGRITAARVGRYLVATRDGWTRACWLFDDLAAVAYEVAKATGRHRVICNCD